MMLKRLGWKDSASSLMYKNQAINSIGKFRSMDDESVKALCKVLCRPGGVAATIAPEPGVKVNSIAKSNLMLALYFINHQDRVSRDVTSDSDD